MTGKWGTCGVAEKANRWAITQSGRAKKGDKKRDIQGTLKFEKGRSVGAGQVVVFGPRFCQTGSCVCIYPKRETRHQNEAVGIHGASSALKNKKLEGHKSPQDITQRTKTVGQINPYVLVGRSAFGGGGKKQRCYRNVNYILAEVGSGKSERYL